MSEYRAKPVLIEAFQMTEERRWDDSEWPDWLFLNRICGEPTIWLDSADPFRKLLFCGLRRFNVGKRVAWDDFIIKDERGNVYPCKPDIFEATYEAVQRPTGA